MPKSLLWIGQTNWDSVNNQALEADFTGFRAAKQAVKWQISKSWETTQSPNILCRKIVLGRPLYPARVASLLMDSYQEFILYQSSHQTIHLCWTAHSNLDPAHFCFRTSVSRNSAILTSDGLMTIPWILLNLGSRLDTTACFLGFWLIALKLGCLRLANSACIGLSTCLYSTSWKSLLSLRKLLQFKLRVCV